MVDSKGKLDGFQNCPGGLALELLIKLCYHMKHTNWKMWTKKVLYVNPI